VTAPRLRIGEDATPLVRDHFRHDPPSPLDLENAIAAVEDEIARVHGEMPSGSQLTTSDEGVHRIALVAGLTDGGETTLGLDAVERAFQRMAARVPGFPAEKELDATLLILGELMHHLQVPAIALERKPPLHSRRPDE
jgi:hypothetical protein